MTHLNRNSVQMLNHIQCNSTNYQNVEVIQNWIFHSNRIQTFQSTCEWIYEIRTRCCVSQPLRDQHHQVILFTNDLIRIFNTSFDSIQYIVGQLNEQL